MKKLRITYAVIFGILLLTEIAIALFVHDRFIRPYIGDVLVTMLLCGLCRIIIPKGIRALSVYVFLFAAAVETAQYFDIVALLGLENSVFLSTVIGRTFSVLDLVCYAGGCLVFFGIDWAIRRCAAKAH